MAPEIVDLHVWRVGREKFAVIVSLVTEDPMVTAEAVRQLLGQHEELVHVSVEIRANAKAGGERLLVFGQDQTT